MIIKSEKMKPSVSRRAIYTPVKNVVFACLNNGDSWLQKLCNSSNIETGANTKSPQPRPDSMFIFVAPVFLHPYIHSR